jgi:hypothetical protein
MTSTSPTLTESPSSSTNRGPDSPPSGKPVDKLLDSITAGVRRRVKAGKQNGELFARDPAAWLERVNGIAGAIHDSTGPDRAISQKDLIDMAAALAAAAYFASVDAPAA